MNKILLVTLIYLLPTLLFSKNYCMYIDQFELNVKNKSKIYSILQDIAYPSTKIIKNQLLIYSGKFKNFEDASKLLMLTKSRYKRAKVSTCEGVSKYKGEAIFKDDIVKKRDYSIKKAPGQDEPQNYYCLRIFDSTLSESAKQKSKINYILNRVPQTRSELKNNRFSIYSGNFTSKESAATIAKILKREFPEAEVSTCETPKRGKKVTLEQVEPSIKVETPIKDLKETFRVVSLDTKGYINKEVASKRVTINNSNLDKSDIRHALDSQREEQFNGLYLKANTAYDVQNSDAAYDVRLEFNLFEQGYYGNKKKNEKYRIDNQINFYRTVKDIEVLKKEQELLKIKKYENSVNVSALLLKLRLYELNLNNAELKLENGLLTEYEFDEYRLNLQEVKDELLLFRNMTLLKIPKELWTLLNQIERTKLISQEKLIAQLKEGSIDLKLVETLRDKKPLAQEWSDRLRVNFYAGVRKMYLAQNQTLVGVEAKIPLSNYSRTAELDNIQNNIMAQQVKLQHSKSEEILKDAIATYKYKQQKLKTYSYELVRIKKRIKNLNTINNSAFASYANISSMSIQKAESDYLNKYTQLQLERLSTYKELINIMYLIHTTEIKNVLAYSVHN